MYEGHFKLRGRPFLAAPDSTRYFPAAAIEAARQALVRTISRGEGPGLVIGPPGTGKSLLCQLIEQEFAGPFAPAHLVNGRFATRPALLQAILHQLGLPYRGLEEGELRLALLDHLDPATAQHDGLLLIVDEAHLLPWRLLDEIRGLTNLIRNGQARVRVVLAGGSVLEERFASPKLQSFSQRLGARCYLSPMDASETAAYVRAQIAAVGGDAGELFDDDALRAVYRASDGTPRLVNQVCDHALVLACVADLRRLTDGAIDEAWADLQQLPAPWSAKPADAPADRVVEFGGLDEGPDEGPTAIRFPAADPQRHHLAAMELAIEECLDAIEQPLSEIEHAFQPAGTIGTQADLEFADLGDPFGERFEQEEIVLDRYGSQVELFHRRPRATSDEGRELGALLASWASARQQVAAASIRLGPSSIQSASSETTRGGDEGLCIVPPPHTQLRSLGASDSDAWPRAELEISRPPADAMAPAVEETDSRASFSRGKLKQVTLAGDAPGLLADCQILVVEDENPRPIVVERAPSPRAPLSRKREYRQLFARLRRG